MAEEKTKEMELANAQLVYLHAIIVRDLSDLTEDDLNDQANYCLIHFYKRCVSSLTDLTVDFSSGLKRVH